MDHSQRAAQIAQALADPLRLTLLRHLMGGQATVAELVSISGASQSNVSNHLAHLRAQKLVSRERYGRQMLYGIADPTVAQLIEALAALAGKPPELPKEQAPLASARTCYDHLAGTLGVALFDALVRTDAVVAPAFVDASLEMGPSGEVTLGPAAVDVFGRLGVDLDAPRTARRQFAYACRDWTERRFHLGGALGAAIYDRFLSAGWVVPGSERRQLRLTSEGAGRLKQVLGVQLDVDAALTPRR